MFAEHIRGFDPFSPAERLDPYPFHKQLGFGYGVHHCLGAPSARLEARVVAEAADRRFRVIAPDPANPPSRTDGPSVRGLETFPLLVQPG